MPVLGSRERALVDALDEPALLVEASIVVLANPPAQRLFGAQVEGRDIRLAIRHPQALERIPAHRASARAPAPSRSARPRGCRAPPPSPAPLFFPSCGPNSRFGQNDRPVRC